MDLALSPRPDTAMPPPPAELPPELVYGCGWYDSSLDLAQGLNVIEHAGADWLAQLPLGAVLQ